MATFMISGSRGTDDPTMATLPFMAAKVAHEQGHDAILWLWNEAVTLARKGTADHVTGVNLSPLKELPCSGAESRRAYLGMRTVCRTREIGDQDLIAGAIIKGMPNFIKAMAERDKSVAF